MKHLYLFALLLCFTTTSFGLHIIGGVVTYECLGNGTYIFTIKMYRDCAGGGAPFDGNAPISIYKGDSQNPITTLHIGWDEIFDIDPEEDPCLILPPNICVQEGVYSFQYTFTDWPSDESYHVSYQRCCRNENVTNIQNPGDIGATFTAELTPASQAVCNNSPVFETFPPVAICANAPLAFDHAATDAEGDQLIYELCEILLGGGQGGLGGGNPNACNGITPDPACPPPYDVAQYIPPYSALNPLGGNPQVTIDPLTGFVTGTPELLGQFTVGVCVSEYRNGELLSVVRREFQFNVVECEPLVSAEIDADIDNDEVYVFDACHGEFDFFFENLSNQSQFIDEFRWEWDFIDSIYVNDIDWHLDITFPKEGTFNGMLLLNPGTQCGDTAFLQVNIYPELVADFTFEYDTCIAGPVTFFDQSFIDGPGQVLGWDWEFGDNEIDTMNRQFPSHIYAEPGDWMVKLAIEDENGCKTELEKPVPYKPVPSLIIVSPNDTVSCPPATVTFNNLSSPIDETYELIWDFGDGNIGNAISPTHTYEETGTYDVSLEIISPIGCDTDTTFSELIVIEDPPVAEFEFTPESATNLEPFVEFTDLSKNAVHWDWYDDGRLFTQDQHPVYEFPDTGFHEITLIITHPEKCLDTVTHYIDVKPCYFFHLPNAFTPNEDTVNDIFKGKGLTRGITNFDMQIWDRWGKMVFQTNDLEEAWNGNIHNSGRIAQAGTYIVTVVFTGPRGEPFEYKGFATLIR